MARDGVTKLSDTALFTSINVGTSWLNQSKFTTELLKVFNVTKTFEIGKIAEGSPEDKKYKYLNGADAGAYNQSYYTAFLTDGTILYIYLNKTSIGLEPPETVKENNGKMKSYLGEITIDVNGLKAPNILGRDLFCFAVDDSGIIFPMGGRDYSLFVFMYAGSAWTIGGTPYSCIPDSNGGSGCAARIMEEGWEMNY